MHVELHGDAALAQRDEHRVQAVEPARDEPLGADPILEGRAAAHGSICDPVTERDAHLVRVGVGVGVGVWSPYRLLVLRRPEKVN